MAIKVSTLRIWVQHLSFAVLMYGGRLGLNLGPALPCFACPYVAGCGGYCYLMGLQGYIGFGMSAAAVGSSLMLNALGWLALFVLMVSVFGKAWCGWVCPFGLLQDWLTALREKSGARARLLPVKTKKRLASIKYLLLSYLVLVPPLVSAGILPPDFSLPFCSICPGKSILPLFTLETRYLGLDLNNNVTYGFSMALLLITGLMLVGMFFKKRFFCVFCPLLALIHLIKPLTLLRLVKEPSGCTGCGNCRRVCPMDNEAVYRERINADVQTEECLDCLKCAEACPSDRVLGLNFLGHRLFTSSRDYASGIKDKK